MLSTQGQSKHSSADKSLTVFRGEGLPEKFSSFCCRRCRSCVVTEERCLTFYLLLLSVSLHLKEEENLG